MEFSVKVQASGKNTYVNIPAAIIKNFEIKKGQKATFEVIGDTIKISFKKKK